MQAADVQSFEREPAAGDRPADRSTTRRGEQEAEGRGGRERVGMVGAGAVGSTALGSHFGASL
ncbi:hypothetical protein CP970_22100 [Streptomyces kanamyceticus]|uniref:Uncharacterized protein n=1 Tax=Streptomyces kanamyceticus TaxID=1967 RepID=A0A5J6GCK0_STRKN|nr:hypothetical protein CP970_22100 [Streptomyces kanamyceticus]